MTNDQLIKLLDFWKEVAKADNLFPREISKKIDLKTEEIIDIIGPRRCGKSSVLKLVIDSIKGNKSFLYVNFEDPYFLENNGAEIIEKLIDAYLDFFDKNLHFLFFDEIQNIKNWEKAVRKLRDSGKYKIFITGSSSKLLSKELSSLLTGRHLSYELFPLSFFEFLGFKKVSFDSKKELISNKNEFIKLFQKYLNIGGFPAIVKSENIELLKQYFDDIVQKDIVGRYEIRDIESLKKIGVFLATNISKTISIRNISLSYGISPEIVKKYLDYYLEAFLFFTLPKFSYSLKKQDRNLNKIYCVDSGLASAVSFKFSEDRGRMLENAVFMHLKRLGIKAYYWNNPVSELDFVLKMKDNSMELIQVCISIADEETRKREIKGLLEASKEIKAKNLRILTLEDKEKIKIGDTDIIVEPVFEWMLKDKIR